MKIKNLLFLLLISSFVVFGCTQNQQQPSMDAEFKQMCQNAGYEWMLMKPTKDGKFIKDLEACWGCMVEGIEHVCDKEKFEDLIKTEPKENGIHAMEHQAMTASAGNKNSVGLHLYKIGFVREDIQLGKENLLKFTINKIDSGKPVSNLEVVHDKIMHVVLVRNDLKHFDHIHPEMKEPGIFTVPYNFPASGLYRTWIDFTIGGMQHIVDFDINVSGNIDAGEKDMLEGVKVNFKSPKEISAGNEAELKFEVFDDNNESIPITKKFLAANAHLIAIDETLQEFGHNHDEKFDKDNIISFKHTFTKAGKYKIWIKFSVEGKTKTASFELTVK